MIAVYIRAYPPFLLSGQILAAWCALSVMAGGIWTWAASSSPTAKRIGLGLATSIAAFGIVSAICDFCWWCVECWLF